MFHFRFRVLTVFPLTSPIPPLTMRSNLHAWRILFLPTVVYLCWAGEHGLCLRCCLSRNTSAAAMPRYSQLPQKSKNSPSYDWASSPLSSSSITEHSGLHHDWAVVTTLTYLVQAPLGGKNSDMPVKASTGTSGHGWRRKREKTVTEKGIICRHAVQDPPPATELWITEKYFRGQRPLTQAQLTTIVLWANEPQLYFLLASLLSHCVQCAGANDSANLWAVCIEVVAFWACASPRGILGSRGLFWSFSVRFINGARADVTFCRALETQRRKKNYFDTI